MTWKHWLIKGPKKPIGLVGKIGSFPNSTSKVLIEMGKEGHPISTDLLKYGILL